LNGMGNQRLDQAICQKVLWCLVIATNVSFV
jgi:hypothetical protein